MTRFYLLSVFAALARAAFAVGDSAVGIFVTPPAWASTGSLTSVSKHYTPFGVNTDAPPVRLNTDAALGMCATLDGFAERSYVPGFTQADPFRNQFYIWPDFDPGPESAWKTNNFSTFPWSSWMTLTWPLPESRNITNVWSRIFPRASDMLEDVRGRLRSLVSGNRGQGPSALNDGSVLSSSLFGGTDTLSFDWCSRDVAIGHLKSVGDDLCLDWSCISNRTRPCDSPINAVEAILNLDYDESTNIFSRIRTNAPAPLPGIYEILARLEPDYSLRDGWLTNSWTQSRIDANDFGWMNKMIAAIDKSYLVYGLPIIQFEREEFHASVARTLIVTNGYFELRWDLFDGPVADIYNIENDLAGDVTNASSQALGPSTAISCGMDSLAAAAQVTLTSETHLLMIDPEEIASDLSSNVLRGVLFTAYTDPERGYVVETAIADRDGSLSTNTAIWTTLRQFYVLDQVKSLGIAGDKAVLRAEGNITWTSKPLLYGDLGTNWPTNYSGRHAAPLPEDYAPGYVLDVSYQLAARRSFGIDGEDFDDEYYAIGGSTSSKGLDDYAIGRALSVLEDCQLEAGDAVGIDPQTPSSSVIRWLNSAGDELFDASVLDADSSASWSVGTIGLTYLLKTNNTCMMFREISTTNGLVYVELPFYSDEHKLYIYGDVSAYATGSAQTNAPSASLSCELESSAAIYWRFKNLPRSYSD